MKTPEALDVRSRLGGGTGSSPGVGASVSRIVRRAICHPWVIVAVGFLVLMAREPYAISRPEFTNEDGQVFFMEAYLLGPASVLHPYAGYLHVLARVLALPQAWMPIELAPLWAGVASLAVTALVAGYVVRLPIPRAAAVAIAAVIVLLPSVRQTMAHIYGIQWYLAMLLVAGAFVRPRWWDYPVLALVALTGPFSVFFLPIYLWVARDWRAVVVGAGAAVQVLVYLTSGRYASEGNVSIEGIIHVLAYRAVAERFVGEMQDWPVVPEWISGLFVLSVLALVGIAVRSLSREAVIVGYVAFVIALVGILFGGSRGDLLIGLGGGGRYFLMAGVALALAALAGLYSGDRIRRVAGAILAVGLSIGMVRDFHVDPFATQNWVRLARPCIGSLDPCVVPVAPSPQWDIHWPGAGGIYMHNGES